MFSPDSAGAHAAVIATITGSLRASFTYILNWETLLLLGGLLQFTFLELQVLSFLVKCPKLQDPKIIQPFNLVLLIWDRLSHKLHKRQLSCIKIEPFPLAFIYQQKMASSKIQIG